MKKLLGIMLVIALVAVSVVFIIRYFEVNSPYTFDIVIKSGTIYDGTLKDPYIADIGIKKDKIVAIGNLEDPAKKIIDANGLIVTPGFIDLHNHSDLTFEKSGLMRYMAYIDSSWKTNYNYLSQGVTTIVTQNCGWGFTNVNKWFSIIDSLRFGTNVYALVPHGAVRNELFGEENPQPLNAEQLELMKKKMEKEMQKGAMGIATGLEYAPGCMAITEEIIELAKVAKKYGGIYVSHIRDNTGQVLEDGEPGVIEALKEAIEIGKKADIPVHISHIQINAPWNNVTAQDLLNLIEEARKEGMNVTADAYPYNAGCTWINLLTPYKYRTSTGIREEYKTQQGRVELKKAVEHTFSYLHPDKVMINIYPENKSYEGKTLKEIADMEGKSPADLYVDIVCKSKTVPMCIFFDQKLEEVETIMPHEYIFTASDGWVLPENSDVPHPRCYGTFPRKIREYVLNKKLMTLKDAIRSMTSLPAEKFNMHLRGKINIGYYADIAVIDLNTIRDLATYKNPNQYSEGIVDLIANGVLSIENGKLTGKRGGRALKRF